MKHIKQDFSLNAWFQAPRVDLAVGPRPKLKFLGIWSFCISKTSRRRMQQHGSNICPQTYTQPWGWAWKIKPFFSESSNVAYQFKGISA